MMAMNRVTFQIPVGYMQDFKCDLSNWWHDYTRRCGNFTLTEIQSDVDSEIGVDLSAEHLKDFLAFLGNRGWHAEKSAEQGYVYLLKR